MKKIELFERAIAEQAGSLKDYGINGTVFWAYRKSIDAENDLIDFNEVIWDEDIDAIAEKYGTRSPRFGHVADGNFHNFILMVDGKVPDWADDMRRDIYKAALKYGGTVTAEHGTGKTRKPYMELQYTPHVLEIMRNVKRAFDPNNILNPGVIVYL